MTTRTLTIASALVVLLSSAARADQSWTFEAGQGLVSVEVGPRAARLNAVSVTLTGQMRELDSGEFRAEVRIPLSSFSTGSAARDASLAEPVAKDGDLVFEGTAPQLKDGRLRFAGTLTVHGATQPLVLNLVATRIDGRLFGHASFGLSLRAFNIALPAGTPDDVHVDVDAGLRPQRTTVATRD